MELEIRFAEKVNSELYQELLSNVEIHDSKRIVNEGEIGYHCDYYTIYYNEGVKYVGLYNVQHCSCNGTEDDEPGTFADDRFIIVDTVEDFYKKCITDSIAEGSEVKNGLKRHILCIILRNSN